MELARVTQQFAKRREVPRLAGQLPWALPNATELVVDGSRIDVKNPNDGGNWRWTESTANSSQVKIPVNREIYRDFHEI